VQQAVAAVNDDFEIIYVPDNDNDEQLFAADAVRPAAAGQMAAAAHMAAAEPYNKLQSSAEEDQVDGLQWPALQQQVLAQWWA
jgi:hypothetical protein